MHRCYLCDKNRGNQSCRKLWSSFSHYRTTPDIFEYSFPCPIYFSSHCNYGYLKLDVAILIPSKHFYSQQHPTQHVYSKGSQIKLAGCQDKSQHIPYVFPLSMTAREGSALGFIWRCHSMMEYFGSVGSNAFRVLCSAVLLFPDLKATQTPRTSQCQGLLPVTCLGSARPYSNLPFAAVLQLPGLFGKFWKGFSPDLKWHRAGTACTAHCSECWN